MRARLVSAATAAVLALVPATLVLGAAPAVADPGGNNGTIKIGDAPLADDDGNVKGTDNDPKVDCTFTVRWFGFDQSTDKQPIWSTVSFAYQGMGTQAKISSIGPSLVHVGGDPAGGGTDLDGEEEYTLSFPGVAPKAQGYHVKVTVQTSGSKGAKKKSKVIWVQPCATTPGEETPGEDTPGNDTPGNDTPGDDTPGDDTPGDDTPGDDTLPPFTWDWTYEDPTCAGVSVAYPANIPDGQANDVNIRIETASGQQTLNFHNNEGFWSGVWPFDVLDHPQFPTGAGEYHITWVQVGGTNYHWQGDVGCQMTPDGPVAMTALGFTGGSKTVAQGRSFTRTVEVGQAGEEDLLLEQLTRGSWKTVRSFAIQDGAAKVTFPRLTKRGTYKFRLAVDGSQTTTGATSGVLTLKVR